MAIYCNLTTLATQPTLASAGTGQAIASAGIRARSVMIYAADTNAGAVYIGTDDTTAKNGKGVSLSPGQGYAIEGERINGIPQMIELASIFFDGATTGNKLVVHYLA